MDIEPKYAIITVITSECSKVFYNVENVWGIDEDIGNYGFNYHINKAPMGTGPLYSPDSSNIKNTIVCIPKENTILTIIAQPDGYLDQENETTHLD